MAHYLVKVDDTLTVKRTSTLIVEADNPYEAECEALDRCAKGVDIEWDEEQCGAEPYEAEVVDEEDAAELIDLARASYQRPAGLDGDEDERLKRLIEEYDLTPEEIRRQFGL